MASQPVKVDRQVTTPFLLKLFHKEGSFTPLNEFHPPLPPHIEIYTWQNCTLRELAHLLTMSVPDLLPEPAIGTRLVFRLIYPDTRSLTTNPNSPGRFLSRELGSVVIGDCEGVVMPSDDEEQPVVADGLMAERLGGDPEVMLRDVKFVIGDHIAVAVLPPLGDGSVAPPLAVGQGHVMGMGRGRGLRPGDQGGLYEPYGSGGSSGGLRENGFTGYRGRPRGNLGPPGPGGGPRSGGFPAGEWRRGEVPPDGPLGFRGRGSYGRGGRNRDRW